MSGVFTDQLGYQKQPTFTDWQTKGTWQGEPLSASSASQANYDNYIAKQNQWQAEGNLEKYNNNLQLHGFYQEPSQSQIMMEQQMQQSMADEAARQERIRAGTASINSAFGQFNDKYYNTVRDDYMGWANPKLEDQQGAAQTDLRHFLAGRGLWNSSVAVNKQSQYDKMLTDANAQIRDQALGYASQRRENVAGAKSSLLGMLNATAGNENAAIQASANSSAEANRLMNFQPVYDTLGDFFYDLVPNMMGSAGTVGGAARGGYNAGPTIAGAGSTGGSETVV